MATRGISTEKRNTFYEDNAGKEKTIGYVVFTGANAEEGIVDTRLIRQPGGAAVEGVARARSVSLSGVLAEEGVVVSIIEPSGIEAEEGITAPGDVARSGVQTQEGVLKSRRAQDALAAKVELGRGVDDVQRQCSRDIEVARYLHGIGCARRAAVSPCDFAQHYSVT